MSDTVDDFSVEQEDLVSQIVDIATETLDNDINDNNNDMDYNYNMNMENRLYNVEIQVSNLNDKLDSFSNMMLSFKSDMDNKDAKVGQLRRLYLLYLLYSNLLLFLCLVGI